MPKINHKPVLVMGARGSVGKLVLDGLVESSVPVRASTRKPSGGQFPDGVDVFAADVTDPTSLSAAFDGVAQVFLYAHHRGVDGVIDAARRAGVETIVLMSSGSVVHPTSAGNTITEEHREVEEAFAAAADLRVIPVRPLVLATNALNWSRPIKAGGSLALYRPDAVTAPIHERDIAAVVVAALSGSEPSAVSEMLTGPARLSQRQQVAAIGAATGKDVDVVELQRGDALGQLSGFMSTKEAEAVLQFLDDAAAGHSPVTDTVSRVLGRPGVEFGVWAADHADAF